MGLFYWRAQTSTVLKCDVGVLGSPEAQKRVISVSKGNVDQQRYFLISPASLKQNVANRPLWIPVPNGISLLVLSRSLSLSLSTLRGCLAAELNLVEVETDFFEASFVMTSVQTFI